MDSRGGNYYIPLNDEQGKMRRNPTNNGILTTIMLVLIGAAAFTGLGLGIANLVMEKNDSPLTSNKVLGIINSPSMFTAETRHAIEKVIDAFFVASVPGLPTYTYDMKNFVAVYGNVFTGEQYSYTKGSQADGSAITPDHSFRWASMTKVVGALVAAKALDEGLFKLDDPIVNYLPEWDCIYLKYVNPDPTVTYYTAATDTVYGATLPLCNVALGPKAFGNAGSQITVRQLLNFNAGFYYDFFSRGDLLGMENGLAAYKWALKTYGYSPAGAAEVGRDYVLSRAGNGYLEPATVANPLYTNNMNGTVTWMRDVPLLYKPGSSNRGLSVYGPEMAVFGAYLTQVVRAKTGDATYNAAKYTIDRIYKPLGIDSTAWFGYGDSAPPSGFDFTKVMDVSIKRRTTSFIGFRVALLGASAAAFYPGITANAPLPVQGSVNTGSSDAQYNWPNYRDQAVFCKNVPGDSSCTFANAIINTPYNENARYIGGFDGTGVGTWNDFAKVLKLYVGKGVYEGKRVIGLSAMRFIQAPQIIGTYYSTPGPKIIETNAATPSPSTPEYAVFVTPGVNSCPITGTAGLTGMDWSFGACVADPLTGPVRFPLSTSFYSWVGYFNTYWFADTETGVYGVYGSQSPKNAQWASMFGRNYCDDIEAAIMSYRVDPLSVPWSNLATFK